MSPTYSTAHVARASILTARLVEASIWLSGASTKTPFNDFGWFPDWVRKEAQYAQIPAYKWFLETLVLPNLTFWGYVQFLTEMALGFALLFGVLVGLSGAATMLWAGNIVLGSYPVPTDEPIYVHMLFLVVPLIVWVTRSGRVLGVDAWLRPRLLADRRAWVRRWGGWAT